MKSLYQLFDLAGGERIYARNVFVQVCTEFNRCKYYSFKCTKHAVEIASSGVSYNADLKKKGTESLFHKKVFIQCGIKHKMNLVALNVGFRWVSEMEITAVLSQKVFILSV